MPLSFLLYGPQDLAALHSIASFTRCKSVCAMANKSGGEADNEGDHATDDGGNPLWLSPPGFGVWQIDNEKPGAVPVKHTFIHFSDTNEQPNARKIRSGPVGMALAQDLCAEAPAPYKYTQPVWLPLPGHAGIKEESMAPSAADEQVAALPRSRHSSSGRDTSVRAPGSGATCANGTCAAPGPARESQPAAKGNFADGFLEKRSPMGHTLECNTAPGGAIDTRDPAWVPLPRARGAENCVSGSTTTGVLGGGQPAQNVAPPSKQSTSTRCTTGLWEREPAWVPLAQGHQMGISGPFTAGKAADADREGAVLASPGLTSGQPGPVQAVPSSRVGGDRSVSRKAAPGPSVSAIEESPAFVPMPSPKVQASGPFDLRSPLEHSGVLAGLDRDESKSRPVQAAGVATKVTTEERPTAAQEPAKKQTLPSVGSEGHSRGDCRPCAHNWRPGGCIKGFECTFCHSCESGALKRRKKLKLVLMRAERRAKQFAEEVVETTLKEAEREAKQAEKEADAKAEREREAVADAEFEAAGEAMYALLEDTTRPGIQTDDAPGPASGTQPQDDSSAQVPQHLPPLELLPHLEPPLQTQSAKDEGNCSGTTPTSISLMPHLGSSTTEPPSGEAAAQASQQTQAAPPFLEPPSLLPGELEVVAYSNGEAVVHWAMDMRKLLQQHRCGLSRRFDMILLGRRVPFVLTLMPMAAEAAEPQNAAPNRKSRLQAVLHLKCADAGLLPHCIRGLSVTFAAGNLPARCASTNHDFSVEPVCSLAAKDALWDLSEATEHGANACVMRVEVKPSNLQASPPRASPWVVHAAFPAPGS